MFKIPAATFYDKSLDLNSSEALAALYTLRILLGAPIYGSRGGLPDHALELIQSFLLWSREAVAHLRKFANTASMISRYNLEEIKTKRDFERALFRTNEGLCLTDEMLAEGYCKEFPLRMRATLQLSRDRLESVWSRERIAQLLPTSEVLGDMLDLTSVERGVLCLAAISRTVDNFQKFLHECPSRGDSAAGRVIAAAAQCPRDEVSTLINRRAALYKHGVLLMPQSMDMVGEWLDLDPRVGLAVAERATTADSLLRHFVDTARRPSLEAKDYAHLGADLHSLVELVREAVRRRTPGIHILLYGATGTGKTELAMLLPGLVAAEAYEVDSDREDGYAATRAQRLTYLGLAQRMLGGRPDSVLIFDEAEDAFPIESMHGFDICKSNGSHGGGAVSKGWINRLLETCAVPVIWTANVISQIDPAFLRRFTYVLEMRTPPKPVRRRMLDHAFSATPVSEALLDELASGEGMSPAEAASTARFADHLCGFPQPELEQRVRRRAVLAARAQGYEGIALKRDSPIPYGLTFLNLESRVPSAHILEALRRSGIATLCFYGPPGTGKTAFGEYIAKSLDRKLMVKTYSSLSSMWVGESEKMIAAAFAEAEESGSVFLLDEADSFLMDRQAASQRWQMTETNEFLARMERFRGIFICTTNLFKELDPAVLRRFDFKIGFKPPKPEQLAELLRLTFPALDWPEARIGHLANAGATPGDLAVVKRQLDLLGTLPDSGLVLEMLAHECAVRPVGSAGGRLPIGFTH